MMRRSCLRHFYPYWKHKFRRSEATMRKRWAKWHGEDFDKAFGETYAHIVENGAVLAREIKQADHKSGGWWQWHPSKKALEYFWHTGKLAISARRTSRKSMI
jgi:uncharacterized protein YcaQ